MPMSHMMKQSKGRMGKDGSNMCRPQKGQEKMKIGCINFAFENRNKAHLKRKSWFLWRQPKNSHVSPNMAEGFWRRCSSLKVNTDGCKRSIRTSRQLDQMEEDESFLTADE